MKYNLIFILAIFTILLASCGTERLANDEMPLVEIYSLALDALMEEDKAQNDDMAFIAIDLSNFENLNKTARQAIIDVMDATFEELREKGFINEETKTLNGVLLRMEKVDITSTKVVFTGSKLFVFVSDTQRYLSLATVALLDRTDYLIGHHS